MLSPVLKKLKMRKYANYLKTSTSQTKATGPTSTPGPRPELGSDCSGPGPDLGPPGGSRWLQSPAVDSSGTGCTRNHLRSQSLQSICRWGPPDRSPHWSGAAESPTKSGDRGWCWHTLLDWANRPLPPPAGCGRVVPVRSATADCANPGPLRYTVGPGGSAPSRRPILQQSLGPSGPSFGWPNNREPRYLPIAFLPFRYLNCNGCAAIREIPKVAECSCLIGIPTFPTTLINLAS